MTNRAALRPAPRDWSGRARNVILGCAGDTSPSKSTRGRTFSTPTSALRGVSTGGPADHDLWRPAHTLNRRAAICEPAWKTISILCRPRFHPELPQLCAPSRTIETVLTHGWQYQWWRVERRLEGVRAVYDGQRGGTDVALDTVLTFFEAVHHLKDWLGNDPTSGMTKAAGDTLINASLNLQLCADIANGSKHLALTSARTGDTSTTIARNDATVYAGTGTAAHRFYITSENTEYDALDRTYLIFERGSAR